MDSFSKKLNESNRKCVEMYSKTPELKAYANATIKTYIGEFTQFLLYFEDKLDRGKITHKEVNHYFWHCIKKLQHSENQIHSRINAVKSYVFLEGLRQDKEAKQLDLLDFGIEQERISKFTVEIVNSKSIFISFRIARVEGKVLTKRIKDDLETLKKCVQHYFKTFVISKKQLFQTCQAYLSAMRIDKSASGIIKNINKLHID